MSHLEQVLDLLPPPYTVAADSVVARLLDVFALEMEAFDEDLDRMRRSHWILLAEHLGDAAKLAALLDIRPFPWETRETFRARLLPLVRARLDGSLGPREIRRFVFEYLRRCEARDALGCLLVPPGLQSFQLQEAYEGREQSPAFRPLGLVENPRRARRSETLAAIGGRVPYLHRWQEDNGGLDESVAVFHVTGLQGGRTAVPVLANLTTGELIGYAATVPFGQTLSLRLSALRDGEAPRLAAATLGGQDVSSRLFGMSGFVMGGPFTRDAFDDRPQLPRLVRGANEWIFLSIGLYDVKGLGRFFFALADAELREGAFDRTAFDRSLFPSGPVARLEMEWEEEEPASFEVRVPRYLVAEPGDVAAMFDGIRPWQMVEEGLRASLAELRAAGVRAEVRFAPFAETQRQEVRVRLPWKVLDPEVGPAGERDEVSLGGRFSDSPFGAGRFE